MPVVESLCIIYVYISGNRNASFYVVSDLRVSDEKSTIHMDCLILCARVCTCVNTCVHVCACVNTFVECASVYKVVIGCHHPLFLFEPVFDLEHVK